MSTQAPSPQVLIPGQEIKKIIKRLAREVKRDFQNTNPLIICVLKGSVVFLSDFIRAMNVPLEIDFVCLSSYGTETESSGKIRRRLGISTPVAGRQVLVVEDIIDTGITINYLLKYLKRKKPAVLKLCALLDKPSRRKVKIPIDYLGMTVPNKFIVGYGIDWNEKFRHLPDICFIEKKNDD